MDKDMKHLQEKMDELGRTIRVREIDDKTVYDTVPKKYDKYNPQNLLFDRNINTKDIKE